MAFVLIQHLDPTHPSLLTELLKKQSPMPVSEVAEPLRVEPNNIYIIPSNAGLEIKKQTLHLLPRSKIQGKQTVIDYFFSSLAEDQKNLALGIILSGNGSDGTLGIQQIKSLGGITFAQDKTTAQFPSMPESAALYGNADFVLNVEQIANQIVYIGKLFASKELKKSLANTLIDEEQLNKIYGVLKKSAGVDFTMYKQTTLERRLQRRLALHKMTSLKEYISFLNDNPSELEKLYNDLLINVTNFFRDPEVFTYLKEKIFPHLLQEKSNLAPVRLWVPGCATGEEVYSLAISLIEFLGDKITQVPIQIFGTDISEEAIEKARTGKYLENIEMTVSAERLSRFFTKDNTFYQVNKSVREMCVFAKQNLLTDPSFSRMDLVSCRNVLIYFQPILQKRVLRTLHFSLKPNGYLVLGPSESIGEFS